VDDELSIINGLLSFDWNAMGIELAGTCKNGLLALQWLETNPVDIVLTDIKMPIMDGIELLNRISRLYPFISVVILSGYDDYSFIRESLKNGVFDYLLKPVQPEELESVMCGLTENIDRNRQQQMKIKILEKKARFSTKYFRQDFLKQLLASPMTDSAIEEGCTYGELSFESGLYTVCLFRLDALDSKHFSQLPDRELILFAFENIFRELCDNEELGYSFVDPQTGDCYVLFTHAGLQSGETEFMKTIAAFKDSLYRIDGLIRSTVSCGIGTACRSVRDIHSSARNAKAALKGRKGTDCIIRYDEAAFSPEETEACPPAPASQPSPASTNIDINSKKHLLKEAVNYINTHYMQSVTLNEVAEHIYINPVYLSNIFKEVIGVNFIHYLTNLRIEEAKKLLQNPAYKVSEVGECVGYENPGYFSKVFKKYTSYTPYEYRCKYQEET
jgi:two-component system response regulator YesN